jgi:MYXO-CTERM domain-containing protein
VTRALLVVCLVLAAPSGALAQAALVTGLGGPLDFGTDSLARGDDSISVAVDLTPAFPSGIDYFGTRYTELYVNTNGNLSFVEALSTFTPDAFPQTSRPIIAAWWADVDTRGLIDGEPDRNLVYYAVTPGRLVATWIDVGYYSNHVDLLNAFQIILTAAPGEPEGTFDVELRYNRCEWTTGDATSGHMMGLGGIAAQAGFDAGDRLNYLTLPGSLTNEILDLCTTSNVDMTGVWQLHPRGSAITATCGNGLHETGEDCDDGNVAPNDGCDEVCHFDTPCSSSSGDAGGGRDSGFMIPDVMLPDANGADANGADATGAFNLDAGGGGELEGGAGGDVDAAMLPPCARPDAAVPHDAGTTPFPDAGRFDGGPRPDAAMPPNDLVVGGSGCSCGVGGHRTSQGAALSIAMALAAIARRRRAR